jgi:hypothetical protein
MWLAEIGQDGAHGMQTNQTARSHLRKRDGGTTHKKKEGKEGKERKEGNSQISSQLRKELADLISASVKPLAAARVAQVAPAAEVTVLTQSALAAMWMASPLGMAGAAEGAAKEPEMLAKATREVMVNVKAISVLIRTGYLLVGGWWLYNTLMLIVDRAEKTGAPRASCWRRKGEKSELQVLRERSFVFV